MLVRLIVLSLVSAVGLYGQTLDSGSDGSDGALDLTTPGEIVFDPIALGLDADRDNVFHFTTIDIGPDVVVKMPFSSLQGLPVVWLATGAVQIDGTIDLNGETGAFAAAGLPNRAAEPGPGGYPGGVGSGGPSFLGESLLEGLGPGGGVPTSISNFTFGGGAGHVTPQSGEAYGNALLVPLRGGSGGSGGGRDDTVGGSGGAGGGAIRIFSSVSIVLNGSIMADGGDGGGASDNNIGGAGSGGGIHLIAPTVSGSGDLTAAGGQSPALGFGIASVGRIRIDASEQSFAGTSDPPHNQGTPYNVPLPGSPPLIRVTTIAGFPISGSSAIPDASIDEAGPVEIEIEAENIPLGTVLRLQIISEASPDFTVDGTPLAGTVELSTATATVTFPPGFSRGFVRATWDPPTP